MAGIQFMFMSSSRNRRKISVTGLSKEKTIPVSEYCSGETEHKITVQVVL